jgi:nitrogenase subunit NifH
MEWVRAFLDMMLIGCVGTGIVQATRLLRHLSGLRASRAEMERFVHEFGGIVTRAENGVRTLKQAARESGDDLEKLVDNAHKVRDELNFLMETADQLAGRLSQSASHAQHREMAVAVEKPAAVKSEPAATPVKEPSTRAEKELLQALQKLS